MNRTRLQLWVRMLARTQRIKRALDRHLRLNAGLTLAKFDLMAVLGDAPQGLSMSALSERLLVSNANVTGIVRRLVEDGYVERLQMARDRRTHQVRLSSQGRQIFERVLGLHNAFVDEVFVTLTDEEVAMMAALLVRLRNIPASRQPDDALVS